MTTRRARTTVDRNERAFRARNLVRSDLLPATMLQMKHPSPEVNLDRRSGSCKSLPLALRIDERSTVFSLAAATLYIPDRDRDSSCLGSVLTHYAGMVSPTAQIRRMVQVRLTTSWDPRRIKEPSMPASAPSTELGNHAGDGTSKASR